MILGLAARGRKVIALSMLTLLYLETVLPQYAFAGRTGNAGNNSRRRSAVFPAILPDAITPAPIKRISGRKKNLDEPAVPVIGGPTQPENQAFASVNNANMVDLYSGNFSYTIPLLDIGGYPLAIGYNSGISMDQEASWVGLGWNINPGTITRNMRGLPDDFSGSESIVKTNSVKLNKTVGASIGGDIELVGFPLSLGASIGVFHNTYKGWGLEQSFNVGINSGSKAMGDYTRGLSITSNSQDGLTSGFTFGAAVSKAAAMEKGGFGGNLSVGLSYNSRSGMKALQFSAGVRQYETNTKESRPRSLNHQFSSSISFANPTFVPSASIPFTNSAFSFTMKAGSLAKVVHPNGFASGYVSKQYIDEADKRRAIPAYGYLNYQLAGSNRNVLLDFNREKDIAYREKPAVPHLAVPAYTYDVFSMSGEGTGGMFRAYRGDVGFVHDPYTRTRDRSDGGSLDFGPGDLTHLGADIHLTRAYTETGPWLGENPMAKRFAFRRSSGKFEAAYFRNPGEKTVNSRYYYDRLGGDDVVAVGLFQAGSSSPVIASTQYLNRYRNKKFVDTVQLPAEGAFRKERDKRTQSISYLTAEEASEAGLSHFIENHTENVFVPGGNCTNEFPDDLGANGIRGVYYSDRYFGNKSFERIDNYINFNNHNDFNANRPAGTPQLGDNFSVIWTGRVKVPETGVYTFSTSSDDGVNLYLNDTAVIRNLSIHPYTLNSATVNLVKGQVINIKMEYFQGEEKVNAGLFWQYNGKPREAIPSANLYLMPSKDTLVVSPALCLEKRVNDFRKPSHISQVDVLNADGRRYIYGIPVYNLIQKETSFSVDAEGGNLQTGMVKYVHGTDNTTANTKGNDNYFSSEEVPAYAHSFLLTGVLSPDYADLTGNGISDDDPGSAIRFNYSKISGIRNAYSWRTPYSDSANYNAGLRADSRDDKGSYVYGQKELWYLHSIESRNMIATFKVSAREDLLAIDEEGIKQHGQYARKLDEINLYVKADFQKYGTDARPVKTVHFEYSYELCPGVNAPVNNLGKLTLKKIWFSYNGNEKGKRNPYVFHYNAQNPAYSPQFFDRWGNYKAPLQNPGSSAGDEISNAEFPYALQDSALAAANAASWTLDSIILPSGGRLKVTYESDDYAYVQNRRAMQMCRIAGFSAQEPSSSTDLGNNLYSALENVYVGIHVPTPVISIQDVYEKYLKGADTLFFKIRVKMPRDNYGNGYEYVNCYAPTASGQYGFFNNGEMIWVKLKPIDDRGHTGNVLSVYSPLAKAAIQFLRLNLPSKAYPGSDVGDGLDFAEGIKLLVSQTENILTTVHQFDHVARFRRWAREVDLNRSWVRLNQPDYKKYGGGLRVKRIVIHDYWNAMTKQKESMYGQDYLYTTTKTINGKPTLISSGVASYEPLLGGEENPWRRPVEYNEQVSVLAPVNLGYTEEPLGEVFYPAPQVGYSKVRVRTIHAKNTRSANGYDETCFYTPYDFPVITDNSLLADGKKRFKPKLAAFLRINARHYVTASQGFKVELNDMSGKIRSQASYPETHSETPVTYTEYFYRVEDQRPEFKLLKNDVMAISPNGDIDPEAVIGKDIELMADMREQRSVTNAYNLNINGDFFTFFIPPVFLIPMALNLAQREETRFRSAAVTKVINRHGILDSMVVIDKGSRITTCNLLYDAETGDPVLTSTRNEHDDPIYKFTFPAAWAYDGMSGAYKNIGVELTNVNMKDGKIISGLQPGQLPVYFASGDELLIASKEKVSGMNDCNVLPATWPTMGILYAVDANMMTGGAPEIVFVDAKGKPFTGTDITMKVIRSGRRNLSAAAGEVVMMKNPLVETEGTWTLALNNEKNIISASAVEYNQFWKVDDKKLPGTYISCVGEGYPDWADTCGTRYFGNRKMRLEFTKNSCGEGFQPGTAVYTVEADMYASAVSQEEADSLANADLLAHGQEYANVHGICTPYFYSKAIDREVTRSCSSGGVSDTVMFHLPAGTDSSLLGQAIADSLANIRATVEGAAYANAHAVCTWKNQAIDQDFTKNNCVYGQGAPINYTLAAGVYSSTISQEDANQKALDAGQAYANTAGKCLIYGEVSFDCPNVGCEVGVPTMTFTFPSPTPEALTIHFAYQGFDYDISQLMHVGSDLFTPLAGSIPASPDGTKPYVVVIPSGVTSYTVPGAIWQLGYSAADGSEYSWKCSDCSLAPDVVYAKLVNSSAYLTNLKAMGAPFYIKNLP